MAGKNNHPASRAASYTPTAGDLAEASEMKFQPLIEEKRKAFGLTKNLLCYLGRLEVGS